MCERECVKKRVRVCERVRERVCVLQRSLGETELPRQRD